MKILQFVITFQIKFKTKGYLTTIEKKFGCWLTKLLMNFTYSTYLKLGKGGGGEAGSVRYFREISLDTKLPKEK